MYRFILPDAQQQSSGSTYNDQLFKFTIVSWNDRIQHGKYASYKMFFLSDTERGLFITCKKYQTIESLVVSFTTHNIPEFSRKFHFLNLFLNTGVCSKRKKNPFCWVCTTKHIQFRL